MKRVMFFVAVIWCTIIWISGIAIMIDVIAP